MLRYMRCMRYEHGKGHEQDRQKKVHWLQEADAMTAEVARLLVARGRLDVVLIVTGDHSTPTAFGDHTCEPVPIAFADVLGAIGPHHSGPQYVHSDECSSLAEVIAGSRGSLGRFPALEIMPLIRRLLCAYN